METINSFAGGMNKDISKSLYKEGSYIHAENFTLITDKGLSTGSLRNSNGNVKFIELPRFSNVIEITSIPVGTSVTVSISGDIQGFFSITITANSIEDFGQQLKDNLVNTGIGVAFTDSRIVIYSLLADNQLVNNTLGISFTSPAVVYNSLYVNNNFGALAPKIMGWEVIRDQVILFTAISYSNNPVNQLGQVWKLIYDKYLDNPVLTMIYNGYLNLSVAHPLPNPGATTGNYEIPSIQKVYWTDNYNRPRVINIADPNVMALTPDLLELNPNILKAVPTIYEVLDSGSLKTGIYQVSARLANTAGASGIFLTPSNPITLINEPEFQKPAAYEARDTGVTVSKSISGKFFNLDTQYDLIEPVVMYRENSNATPDIFILPAQPVPDNGEFAFRYTGTETVVPISLEEFLETKIIFDTVKTMAPKNNILFFGNVKYSDFDIDFDTRAYRFTGNNAVAFGASKFCRTCLGSKTVQIKDSAGNFIPVDTTWNNPVDPQADAIQDIEMQSPDSTCNYLFQSDGLTYGGEGPNVKYEFVRMYGVNDRGQNRQYRTLLDLGTNAGTNLIAPYAFTVQKQLLVNYNLDSPPQTGYTQGKQVTNLYPNQAGPFGSYLTKGYQRDEMYRFGVVFFSKKGQPSYVHWIADIRMPKPYMPDPLAAGPDNRDVLYFPISSVETQTFPINSYSGQVNPVINPATGDVYGNNLGIKFTLSNLASIRDQISGYSIVRVKRQEFDKTILGQGILDPIFYSGTGNNGLKDNNYMWFAPNQESWAKQMNSQPNPNGTAAILGNQATLVSPEFLFKTSPSYSSADQVDIVQVNNTYSAFTTRDTTQNNANSTSFKFYNVWEPGTAPRSANFSTVSSVQDRATPTSICEIKDISVGFDGGGFQYSSNIPAKNWGWTGDADGAGPSEDCSPSVCCRATPSLPGNTAKTPRGIGGSRLYLGVGGCAIGNTNGGLTSIGLGAGFTGFDGMAQYDSVTQLIPHPITNIYLANYRRKNVVQYGGNTFSARAYNEYIPTGHTQLVTSASSTHTDMVFGGDTYITLFDYAAQLRNGCLANVDPNTQTSYSKTRNVIQLVPLENSFPIELRKNNGAPVGAVNDGYTTVPRTAPNKAVTYADLPAAFGGPGPLTAEWVENFNYEFDYISENDIMKFFPAPFPRIAQGIYDVRIHRSQVKTNGEISDSWGVFKPQDYLDLDTAQGELNNLIIHQNYLVSFQNKGVALVSVNDRALSQDVSGSEIILGTGGILARYDYLSRVIGTRHQFSFTKSHDAIFWFDMNTKNMYKMSGNAPVAISVSKGMTSYFNNNLSGIIQVNDNPYLDKGITATYDFRYNEAIMTFKDSLVDDTKSVRAQFAGLTATGEYQFNVFFAPLWLSTQSALLVSVKNKGVQYFGNVVPGVAAVTLSIAENPVLTPTDIITLYAYKPSAFTVGYNDFIDAFTSFYSFTPSVYVNDSVSIFSVNNNLDTLYRHDVGPHGEYYGVKYPSKVSLIVNQSPTETKVFDNYEIVSESIDDLGTHITDDIFSKIRLYNDYQNTDFQTLPLENTKETAKRKERTWNISNLRNRVLYISSNSPNIFDPVELSSPSDKEFGERMRDKYLIVDLEYDNLNNYNFVFHTFKSHFRKSAR